MYNNFILGQQLKRLNNFALHNPLLYLPVVKETVMFWVFFCETAKYQIQDRNAVYYDKFAKVVILFPNYSPCIGSYKTLLVGDHNALNHPIYSFFKRDTQFP